MPNWSDPLVTPALSSPSHVSALASRLDLGGNVRTLREDVPKLDGHLRKLCLNGRRDGALGAGQVDGETKAVGHCAVHGPVMGTTKTFPLAWKAQTAVDGHPIPAKPVPKLFVEKPPARPLKTVLLVDDDDAARLTMKWFLANCDFAVESVRSAEEALAVFDPKIHDVVLTDNTMPGMSGGEMAHIIKLRSPATPVIMHTGMAPQDQSCIDVVIRKPAHLLTVKDALDMVLARRQR